MVQPESRIQISHSVESYIALGPVTHAISVYDLACGWVTQLGIVGNRVFVVLCTKDTHRAVRVGRLEVTSNETLTLVIP